VGKKIGEGSFGVVFEGTNLLNGHIVAIKFEPRKSDAPQLRDEYRSYRILQGCPGIPQAYYYGTEGLHNVLCIDLLGPNLEDLFDLCGRKFSVKTVAMLAKQMIERVQSIHEKNLIYRDIKPDNFLIGLPGTRWSDTIYMVDFGMAKLWRDPRTRQHIPYRERKSLSGTARYMSINTHLGREQSRRDDLEGLGHVFMYFLRGSLPWQGLKAANNKQKYERIGERKQTVPIADLCEGFPEEFSIYLNYVRKLGFEEAPDYDFLKELFAKVLRSAGEADDTMYDWKLLNSGRGWEANSVRLIALYNYTSTMLEPTLTFVCFLSSLQPTETPIKPAASTRTPWHYSASIEGQPVWFTPTPRVSYARYSERLCGSWWTSEWHATSSCCGPWPACIQTA
ncbi:kinase-like protein, partial [Clavulina sp. PMI_390]